MNHPDLNRTSKDLIDTALSFTRFGLSVAGSAVGYAAEILKDMEHELKVASRRVDPEGTTDSSVDETAQH